MHLYIDAYTTGAGAVLIDEIYHMEFPDHIFHESHPICHMEVFNAVAALTNWANRL